MLLSNCRVDTKNGIEFYEQDILIDDYVYYGNMQITMNVSYISPGFGIVIFNGDSAKIRNESEMYMVRVGYNEASVIYKKDGIQKKLYETSVNLYPEGRDIVLIFSKNGKNISLSLADGTNIISYSTSSIIDMYTIGYYSNGGNSIKNISTASAVPEDWSINMMNTNGGHIKFSKNSFQIKDCKDAAEIEQSDIPLKKGTYYLKYDKVKVDNSYDIKPYVFIYNDDNYYDDKKSILKEDKIILKEDSIINLKFKGTFGEVSKIHLSNNFTDNYIATLKNDVTINGSYIKIDLTKIKEVTWTGVILEVPAVPPSTEEGLSDYEYFIFKSGDNIYKPNDLNVLLNKEYSYRLTKEEFEVVENDIKAVKDLKTVILFNNMNAVITKMTLIEEDGQVINLIAEETTKKIIPAPITSPIVVVDDNNIPLDLSSSYRIYSNGDYDKYVFTNVEREIFKATSSIKLTNSLADKPGAIKIYGIQKGSKVDMKNILKIPSASMDNISLFCEKHDVLLDKHLYHIDYDLGILYFYNEDVEKYDYIVVDYLKNNSYCVNYIKEFNNYEVDISANKTVNLLYDGVKEAVFSEVQNYKITDIVPQQNCYIVLKREDSYEDLSWEP